MERQRLPTNLLIRSLRTAALALALGGAVAATGCANPLVDARLAWDEGDGDLEEADRLYREALVNPNTEPLAREELYDIYVELGDEAAKAKKALKAQEYYEKALEMEPESPEALSGLAKALRDMHKFDEALAVAKRGIESDCKNCRRMYAVLLIRRGDTYMAEGKWAEAEQDYSEALAIIPDATVTLAAVRARYARKDLDASAKGLRDAVGVIGASDIEARRQFLELRRAVVLLALAEGQTELADELLDLAPVGVGGEEQLGLAMEVAMEFRKQGKPDEALSRLMALVDGVAQGKIKLSPARIEELRDRVATIYGARASLRLAKGDIDGAAADLTEATGMRPSDASFKLQQVLVTAAKGNVSSALSKLGKVDKKAKGYNEVSAILASLEVDRLVAAGRLDDARAELERAKKLAPELPEVHVAIAQVLAKTEAAGITRAESSELRKGPVKYPGGKVVRAAEALSELDWSTQQIRGLGTTYPYRAPGIDKRIRELKESISGYYTHPVKFQSDPKTTLVLKTTDASAASVKVSGNGADATKEIPAGGSAKVVVAKPGVVRLTKGGASVSVLAEPYTEVEVGL